MNVEETKRFYKLHLIRSRIKNGLILFTLRNLLVRLGLDLGAYYWVLEGNKKCIPPKIKDDINIYSIHFLTLDDVIYITNSTSLNANSLLKGFSEGQLCLGLKHGEQLAAFMFIELNTFTFKHRLFKLSSSEAYLLNMYTYEAYRGKNLAPYLRYHSYGHLKNQGRDTIYSITEYFNKSSIKFKEKLKAQPLRLYFYIILFKKYHWDFLLKDYSKL